MAWVRVLAQVEFREDLKGLYKQAGCANKPTVFLFDETQIVNESFLEDVNNILSSGEVGGCSVSVLPSFCAHECAFAYVCVGEGCESACKSVWARVNVWGCA